MTTDTPIVLTQPCRAAKVPSGDEIVLAAGTQIWLTQSLGGSYTAMTDHGHVVHIDGDVGRQLGFPPAEGPRDSRESAGSPHTSVEEQVWNKLRTCFDPEIPVNIVDLGLIYDCQVDPLAAGGHRIAVKFTLTAQGCGMGEVLRADIRSKLLSIVDVREVSVDLVWDPPWNQGRISESAKHVLGIE